MCSSELGSIKCNLETTKIGILRWENMSTTIAKLPKSEFAHLLNCMSTSGLSHKQQASSRPHFRKVVWKMVKNCVRNRSRPDEIDTETEIGTSVKSDFYFRFRWPPSTKSTLISYISFRVFVTICGKTCPPQSWNWKNRILHTSKIANLLPVCLRNNRHLAYQISEPYEKFYRKW